MGVLRVKPGVEFTVIAPSGFRILGALDSMAAQLTSDLTITSACDGEHSGPDDPHHRGEAYDVRSHDLQNKEAVLAMIMTKLEPEWPIHVHFYGFLEDAGSSNEHLHVQQKRGTLFP